MENCRPWAVAAVFALGSVGTAHAQEVAGGATTTAKAMTKGPAVTQAQLDNGAKETGNWLHPNGSYEQTRYYLGSRSTPATSRS